MIEGNLEDISLPGLLQLLAAESTKSYRLRISKGGQNGDVFVCDGHLLVATFGILEGLDALSEFLNWSDGEFVVEKLPSHFKTTIRSNINLNLSDPGCFADQCAFLYESNVGLNTEIVPSRTFGTAEWQDALHVQPLEKEDYAILGWITDGRTMRQAMREFQFDLKKTIGVLYRLLITRSVEVVRPTAYAEPPAQAENFVKLANKELARHTVEPVRKQVTVEFHATDIGGARARPRDTGSGLRALTPVAPSDNVLSSSPDLVLNDGESADDKSSSKDEKASLNVDAKLPSSEDNAKSPSDDGNAKSPSSEDNAKSPSDDGNAESPSNGVDAKSPPSKDGNAKSPVKVDEQKSSSNGVDAKSPVKESDGNTSEKEADAKSPAKVSDAKPPKQSDVGTDTVETSAVRPQDIKNNLSKASDGESNDSHENLKKQLKKAVSMAEAASSEVPMSAVSTSTSAELASSSASGAAAKTASGAGSTATSTTATKLPPVTVDSVTSIAPGGSSAKTSESSSKVSSSDGAKQASAAATHKDAESKTLPADGKPPKQDPAAAEASPASLNSILGEEFDEEAVNIGKAELPDASKVLNVVTSTVPVAKPFDERRTDPLPLVSIDIERLLASTFQLTSIGQRALENTSLDELLKQVLLDVEKGKTLLLVLTDSNRSESAVLASYRYCLDRGYIEHSDSVMSLTVDLLLDRLELEQYLLQRRRITGDQLRDMVAISHRQGIGLDKLLVAAGYMLPIDMDRVRKEKERFAPR